MREPRDGGPVRGSGDFLKDMGYQNLDEARVKFALANSIALAIEDRGLSQAEAAQITGVSQPDISRIANGIMQDMDVFRLMSLLAALGKDLSIRVRGASGEHGRIAVAESKSKPLAAKPTP